MTTFKLLLVSAATASLASFASAQVIVQDNFDAPGQSATTYVPGQSYWSGRGAATPAPSISANAATGGNALTIAADTWGPYGYWSALTPSTTGAASGVSIDIGSTLQLSFSLTKLTPAAWSTTGVSFGLLGNGTWGGTTQHPLGAIDQTKGFLFSLGSGANEGGAIRSVTNGFGTGGAQYSNLTTLTSGSVPTGASFSTDLAFQIKNVDGNSYLLTVIQDGIVLGSTSASADLVADFQYAGVGITSNTAANIKLDNYSVGFVSAIPEPSTYGLIGAGALGAVALVRRRRKKA